MVEAASLSEAFKWNKFSKYDDRLSEKSEQVVCFPLARQQVIWKFYSSGSSYLDKDTTCLTKLIDL